LVLGRERLIRIISANTISDPKEDQCDAGHDPILFVEPGAPAEGRVAHRVTGDRRLVYGLPRRNFEKRNPRVTCFTLDRRALPDIAPCKRPGIGPQPPKHPKDAHMFSKTLIAALIVASAALAVTTKVNAGPAKQAAPSHETSWMDRASTNYDGGGY
jgi:hypothetical protein